MSFLTTMAVAGVAVVAGISTRRKAKSPCLAQVLTDRVSNQTMLRSSPPAKAITQVRQLTQDLFSDTRQQQQQALNAAYDVTEAQHAEQEQKENFLVATTGLGLATVGVLGAPIFYLVPSVPSTLFAFSLPMPTRLVSKNVVSIIGQSG